MEGAQITGKWSSESMATLDPVLSCRIGGCSPILSLRFKKAPAADWFANRLSPLPTHTSSTHRKMSHSVDTITHICIEHRQQQGSQGVGLTVYEGVALDRNLLRSLRIVLCVCPRLALHISSVETVWYNKFNTS